jgi:hypothetical protein
MTNGAMRIAPFAETFADEFGVFLQLQRLKSPALRGFIAQRPESEANGVDRRVGLFGCHIDPQPVTPFFLLQILCAT